MARAHGGGFRAAASAPAFATPIIAALAAGCNRPRKKSEKIKIPLDKCGGTRYNRTFRNETEYADVAHLVERHLAKVEVASSSLVVRSKKKKAPLERLFQNLVT